jgi:hypothetical protein
MTHGVIMRAFSGTLENFATLLSPLSSFLDRFLTCVVIDECVHVQPQIHVSSKENFVKHWQPLISHKPQNRSTRYINNLQHVCRIRQPFAWNLGENYIVTFGTPTCCLLQQRHLHQIARLDFRDPKRINHGAIQGQERTIDSHEIDTNAKHGQECVNGKRVGLGIRRIQKSRPSQVVPPQQFPQVERKHNFVGFKHSSVHMKRDLTL